MFPIPEAAEWDAEIVASCSECHAIFKFTYYSFLEFPIKNIWTGASNMGQWVKEVAAKPDALS